MMFSLVLSNYPPVALGPANLSARIISSETGVLLEVIFLGFPEPKSLLQLLEVVPLSVLCSHFSRYHSAFGVRWWHQLVRMFLLQGWSTAQSQRRGLTSTDRIRPTSFFCNVFGLYWSKWGIMWNLSKMHPLISKNAWSLLCARHFFRSCGGYRYNYMFLGTLNSFEYP